MVRERVSPGSSRAGSPVLGRSPWAGKQADRPPAPRKTDPESAQYRPSTGPVSARFRPGFGPVSACHFWGKAAGKADAFPLFCGSITRLFAPADLLALVDRAGEAVLGELPANMRAVEIDMRPDAAVTVGSVR